MNLIHLKKNLEMRRMGQAVYKMVSRSKKLLLFVIIGLLFAAPAAAQSVRIKDLANVRGFRNNQLVGFGLTFWSNFLV